MNGEVVWPLAVGGNASKEAAVATEPSNLPTDGYLDDDDGMILVF